MTKMIHPLLIAPHSGMVKTGPNAIDQLLEREERDEHARQRDSDRVVPEWHERRHPEALHVVEEVLEAEPRHAAGDSQNDNTAENLDPQAPRSGHRPGELAQIHVLVATGSERHPDKHAIG